MTNVDMVNNGNDTSSIVASWIIQWLSPVQQVALNKAKSGDSQAENTGDI